MISRYVLLGLKTDFRAKLQRDTTPFRIKFGGDIINIIRIEFIYKNKWVALVRYTFRLMKHIIFKLYLNREHIC